VTKPANFANDLRDQLIALFQPSDNKLAMKLFGNKNALLKEKLRQKAVGKWVIHPCSNFRFELRHYTTRALAVCDCRDVVCLSVCLSVNAITPEPLEISSRNFQASSKGRPSWQVRKGYIGNLTYVIFYCGTPWRLTMKELIR